MDRFHRFLCHVRPGDDRQALDALVFDLNTGADDRLDRSVLVVKPPGFLTPVAPL